LLSSGAFTLGPVTPFSSTQTVTSIKVSPDGSQLYVATFASSSIEDYSIGAGGALTLLKQLPVTVGLPTVVALTGTCPGVDSTCIDNQNLSVTINPGTLTISTPYTASSPFILPPLSLSSDSTYLSTSASFPSSTYPNNRQIVVTSTLAADPGWSLSVSATDLTDGTGGTISSSGLGLTSGPLIGTGTDANTGPGAQPQIWASTTAGDGTAVMRGTLTLLAPTSTPPGTYSGTITFSVS
jgi:hypothetical protein